MTLTRILTFAVLATSASALVAAPTVRDFELPPGPSAAPTSSAPQVQGPVDPEAPVATRPRTAPVPTSPPAPQPSVTPTATAAPAPSQRPSAPVSRTDAPTGRAAAPQAEPAAANPDASSAVVPGEATASDPAPVDSSAPPVAPPAQAPAPLPQAPAAAWWPWALGLLALIGAIAGTVLWRRKRASSPAAAPQIELLLVTPEGQEPQVPVPVMADTPPLRHSPLGTASSLRIEATPTHLTRSLMAASFSCRVALVNRGDTALDNVTVGLDLTTAHSNVPTSEQLADPARALPKAAQIARIAPGESIEFAHEVRLPTSEIRTLRQGAAHLYVPLLRVRAEATGSAPVARTFIVGTLPEAGAQKLQPFRLDEMPQTYRMIGLAALD